MYQGAASKNPKSKRIGGTQNKSQLSKKSRLTGNKPGGMRMSVGDEIYYEEKNYFNMDSKMVKEHQQSCH
jgi:hypothetical protein